MSDSLTGAAGAVAAGVEAQGQSGAGADGAAGQRLEGFGKFAGGNHGIPPLVEADRLGEQFGAEAVGLAGDRIQQDAHSQTAVATWPGVDSTGDWSQASQGPY